MSQSPNNSAASSLFCSEDSGYIVSDDWISVTLSSSSLPSHFSPLSDESAIVELFESEANHIPYPDYLRQYRNRSIDITTRQDSINWILKLHEVHSFYQFKPITALLSVNYLDRFLSFNSLPRPNGWPFQLLSMACLSLVAKMKEPEVPLVLDLQIFKPKHVFKPKTVRQIELWVMAKLQWRLRSITPYDFLRSFISKLPYSSSVSNGDLSAKIFLVSSDLILGTIRAIDFLGFLPSTIAAAAVICAAGETVDFTFNGCNFSASFHERLNQEMARSCHQLMEEYLIDMCPSSILKERRPESSAPPSPVGVLNAAACGSCDTRSDNPSLSNHAEPRAKRHGFAPGINLSWF